MDVLIYLFSHFHFQIYGIVETSTQRMHDAGKEAAHRPEKGLSKALLNLKA